MKANGTNPSQHALPVVILGTDAAFAAAPATPVQLAHACLRAGFASVIPANWGDELVASHVLRRLADRGPGPAIQCTCPIVAHRLLAVSADLRHVMVPLVSPPVAVARYIRAVSHPTPTRITFVGACPGALDESIDIRMTPAALLELLAERQIVPEDQPQMFESVLPPDRRRFWSQPGGLPSPEVLWRERDARSLIEITGEDISTEIAQHLLSGKTALVDASARLGCVCSGAAFNVPPADARLRVTALEPPRAASPIIEERRDIELDLLVPAASRSPLDVVAAVDATRAAAAAAHALPPSPVTATGISDAPNPVRHSPVRGTPSVEQRGRGSTTPTTPRPVLGGVPIARGAEGRTLPRAYVARRRPSPRSTPVVPAPPAMPARQEPRVPAAPSSFSSQTPPPPVAPTSTEPSVDSPVRAMRAAAGPVAGLSAVPEERSIPLAAATEPVFSPSPSPTPEVVTSRPLRTTPRDMAAAAAHVRADDVKRDRRRRAGLIALFFAAVIASTAVGVVIGHWFDTPRRSTTAPNP